MTLAPQERCVQRDPEVNMSSDGDRIVISGMAGLFPEANSVKELSSILYEKINPINSSTRWDWKHPEASQYLGKISGLNLFDAQFFMVNYRLAAVMDPMSRKILEQTYQAIFDAGVNPQNLSGKKVAVYIGTSFAETEKIYFYTTACRTGLGIAGCSKTMFANRISYWLNVKGPSFGIEEDSCSGISALEQAYITLNHGDCEAAIVASGNVSLHPHTSIHRGRALKMSSDDKNKSFDANADGFVNSESINVLFLQKAKDARRIYGYVKHIKSEFISLLNEETGPRYGFCRDLLTSARFFKEFYEEAGVPPKLVEYVEALGSAVPEADKCEIETIEKVFCMDRKDPVLIGSVMSNIGNAEAASGIASIIKILLGYEKGILAGNLHYTTPREDLPAIKEGRIRVLTDNCPFRRTYTAVNSMSITGINAHVLLEGHNKPKDLNKYKSDLPYLVSASGRHEAAVERILNELKNQSIDPEQLALLHNIHSHDISGHLARGFVIIDTDKHQGTVTLFEKIEYYNDTKRPLWFVYSGMGSQWPGMGTQLMRIPIFAEAIKRCQRVLEPKGIDIIHIITSNDISIFDNILHSFVGIAAVQIGLTDVLREIGLVPDKIIGHSVGELGCAYADGCLTLEEMILSAYSRGLVSLQTPLIHGSMAAVALGYQQIKNICPPEIEVACHNGPQSSTISGPADAIHDFVTKLMAQGIFAKEVPCSNIAYHSSYIANAGPGLLKYLSEVIKTPKLRSERWLSTSIPQANWNTSSAKYSSAEYYTNNLLSPVLFEETSTLIPANAVLVEIAPHGLLQGILKRSLQPTCHNLALTKRDHPDNAYSILQTIGKLYNLGYSTKLEALYPKVEFPVSTGTPMLSHLVEWSHKENWPLCLYELASVKTASVCKFVICITDEEHSFLQGHAMRGNITYPFAGGLVAVWDTLAMYLGIEKNNMSVQFRNIHVYTQPILHEQRQMRLSVSLHRGSGQFEITDDFSQVMTGFITNNDRRDVSSEISRDGHEHKELSSDDIYELLQAREYLYSGEFRSIHSANTSFTQADMVWNNNWVTLIDGLFQLNALRREHDGVSLPSHIRFINIDVKEHRKQTTGGKTLLKANVSEIFDMTQCGGIVMQHVKFHDLPVMSNEMDLDLHHLTLERNLQMDIDVIVYANLKTINKQQSNLAINNLRPLAFAPKFGEAVKADSVNSINNTNPASDKVFVLKIKHVGDIDSLHWHQIPEPIGSGIKVTVHYAGINIGDILKATGEVPLKPNSEVTGSDYGIDFSGLTDSGDRVMGMVQAGACSSYLFVQPELLWPVPAHWTLRDAATVPFAYTCAFYCLCMKAEIRPGMNILVHGGAGALGQAAIAVALAHGCQVFTTVSNNDKKQFLLALYPDLKEEHIGNSRDDSFVGLVFNATMGKGCDIIISSVKGLQKNCSLKCSTRNGITLDTAQVLNQENFEYGMFYMTNQRSYLALDFMPIFEDIEERQILHMLVSIGISRGYVRPLTCLTYAPCEVSRAFRLLALSQHRGRILLHISDTTLKTQSSLECSADSCHLLIFDRDMFGLKLANKLISRGVKKLYLHFKSPPTFVLRNKIKSWRSQNVHVDVSFENFNNITMTSKIREASLSGPIEGIYVLLSDTIEYNKETLNGCLTELDLLSRQLCPSLKYFTVVSINDDIGQEICLSRVKEGIPATSISVEVPKIMYDNKGGSIFSAACYRRIIDEMERALLSFQPVLIIELQKIQRRSLLQQITKIPGVTIPKEIQDTTTLAELGIGRNHISLLRTLFRDSYSFSPPEDQISLLTINRINEIENSISEVGFKKVTGLDVFFSYVDPDELLAITEIVCLPTIASTSLINDEFDTYQQYVCILPGVEGHHKRFRSLCERIKLPTFVLQPGLSATNETLKETALRYTKILIDKTGLKDNFYLVGYESGILVALQMAVMLENLGKSGTVFCIGAEPEELKQLFEEELKEFATEEQLQNAVTRHMLKLLGGDNINPKIDDILASSLPWKSKVDACVRTLLGHVSHSVQYVSSLIESAFFRIQEVRCCSFKPVGLRSQIVLLRSPNTRPYDPFELQAYSQRPVVVHDLVAPFAYAVNDVHCATFINQHLNPDILEAFEKSNRCTTYVLSSSTLTLSSGY